MLFGMLLDIPLIQIVKKLARLTIVAVEYYRRKMLIVAQKYSVASNVHRINLKE